MTRCQLTKEMYYTSAQVCYLLLNNNAHTKRATLTTLNQRTRTDMFHLLLLFLLYSCFTYGTKYLFRFQLPMCSLHKETSFIYQMPYAKF